MEEDITMQMADQKMDAERIQKKVEAMVVLKKKLEALETEVATTGRALVELSELPVDMVDLRLGADCFGDVGAVYTIDADYATKTY